MGRHSLSLPLLLLVFLLMHLMSFPYQSSTCPLILPQLWILLVLLTHALRRSHRVTTLPSHLRDFHCFSALASLQEPQTFHEASSNPLWQQAMKEEFDALHKTGTWDLVDLPFRKSAIDCKWVYKIKTRSDGTVYLATRLALLPRVLLRSMRLIMRRLLLLWLDFLLSRLLFPFLRLANGHSFIWMSKMLFLMVNSQRKSI